MSAARDIVLALGGRWHSGYGMALCPVHDDGREPALKVWDGDNGPLVHCYGGCDWRDVRAELTRRGLLDDDRKNRQPHPFDHEAQRRRREEQELDRQKRIELALSIWRASKAADETAVCTYLRGRGITIPIPPTIRYSPGLKHGPTGLFLPAMVAAVQGPDGNIQGIHRTFLTADGTKKAPVSPDKMMFGACAGGAVRLAKAAERMALAEGLETALSVQQAANIPTWACISAGGIEKVILPQEAHEIVLCADGDDRGEKAVNKAGQRFLREGRRARIARAPKGYDFNDVLNWPENVVAFRERKHG